MTQLYVDYDAVRAFNNAAPALDSIVIDGRRFEIFHDYYHNRPLTMRYGNICEPSIMMRVDGEFTTAHPNSALPYSPIRYVFRKGSKNWRELDAWLRAMHIKHCGAVPASYDWG